MLNAYDATYAEIFARRASSYHEAMRMWPDARNDEFRALLALADIGADNIVLDIPSGGGYLSRFIHNRKARLIQIDPSNFFVNQSKRHDATAEIIQSRLDKLPFDNGIVSMIISMVGLHHEPDRIKILSEWRRVITQDGKLLIAEVDENSEVASFLNEFVHRYNPLGHHGLFFNPTFLDQIHAAGWEIKWSELTDTCWRFTDIQSAAQYFRMLFDLQLADKEATIIGIQKYLVISETHNEVLIRWPLRQLMLTR